ncbi:MAG: CAP domain-containing protein [Proteobacteria bacterium]|nr:CAP domain-containing protein [Pseudomonadota bacterium]
MPAARLPIVALAIAIALVAALAPGLARADVVAAVNRARSASCGRAQLPALRRSGDLDRAAARLARGASLHEALAILAVHPEFATAVELGGVRDDAGIEQALRHRSCGDLGRQGLREVGVAHAGPNVYLIVAAPLAVPAAGDRARVEREVLARVNEARAVARRCGSTRYPAVPPLQPSSLLSRIAAGHSATMAARDDLAHRDPDGSLPADRVRRGGYVARIVGENVASGVPTAAEVVAGWLQSPGHCANIMDARFQEMGVAFEVAPHTQGAIYWTQLFAAPRA